MAPSQSVVSLKAQPSVPNPIHCCEDPNHWHKIHRAPGWNVAITFAPQRLPVLRKKTCRWVCFLLADHPKSDVLDLTKKSFRKYKALGSKPPACNWWSLLGDKGPLTNTNTKMFWVYMLVIPIPPQKGRVFEKVGISRHSTTNTPQNHLLHIVWQTWLDTCRMKTSGYWSPYGRLVGNLSANINQAQWNIWN